MHATQNENVRKMLNQVGLVANSPYNKKYGEKKMMKTIDSELTLSAIIMFGWSDCNLDYTDAATSALPNDLEVSGLRFLNVKI